MKSLLIALLFSCHVSFAADIDKNNLQKPKLNGWVYGAGIFNKQQLYKGAHQRNITIPFIGFVGEKLNVFGPYINYSFVKKKDWTLAANLVPRFSGFNDSDSDVFFGMRTRKDSLDAGLTIKYAPKNWSIEVKTLNDILSNSKGSELILSLASKYKVMGLTIEPKLSVNQYDKNLSDYYYGVQADEATSLRPQYQGRLALNKTVGVAITAFVPIGIFRLDLNNTWYDSGITDSPLTDRSHAFGARLAFLRFF